MPEYRSSQVFFEFDLGLRRGFSELVGYAIAENQRVANRDETIFGAGVGGCVRFIAKKSFIKVRKSGMENFCNEAIFFRACPELMKKRKFELVEPTF